MTEWTRRADAGTWIRPVQTGTLLAVGLALVTFWAAAWGQYRLAWTPTQQAAFPAYLTSTAASAVGWWPLSYTLPGTRIARRYDNAETTAYLRQAVYGGRSILALAGGPLALGGIVLFLGLWRGVPHDLRRARERRDGRRLTGPQLVDAATFNATVKGDGLRLPQTCGLTIRIPRALEAHHILAMADTGTGKSTILRNILVWIKGQGDLAIVVDPAREFLPQFYDEARGDVVLNPLDARCPYWSPGAEVRREEEALTVAEGLFQPDGSRQDPYFQDWSQKIFAKLISRSKPDGHPYSPHELADTMANGPMLEKLLASTGAAWAIDPAAGPQRGGVISSLNRAEHALRLLPQRHQTTGTWSARTWAAEPRGWIFLTSNPETRKAQLPLMTLWLDLLILRLMNPNQQRPKVWIVIDELASLNRIPKLHAALTENRRANVPIVLGFQARGQLRALYGEGFAEAMLSQPATKILLRTTDPDSAEWMSKLIGSVETERMQASRSERWPRLLNRTSINESIRREVKPLILPSQLQGLPDRQGLLKHGNLVVTLAFDYLSLPAKAPAFIERAAPKPTPVLSELLQ